MRAMTVQVNEVIGVGGFIHPGDLVDVLTTMQTPLTTGSQVLEVRSRIVLQNIRVLAVGEDMVTQNAKPVKVPVVTLLVTPWQSERLALASTQGKLQLTMRSQSDQDEQATPGISPPELLELAKEAPPAPAASHHHASRHVVASAPPPPAIVRPREPDVVEVLRGDRFEERKIRSREP
jgi:pilus assembly protein CpaB